MRNLLVAIVCGMLIGCSVAPLNKSIVRQEPYRNLAGKSLTISANRIVDAVQLQKEIGRYYSGTACFERGARRWGGGSEVFMNEISNHVRKKLEDSGYSVVGKAYSPFNEELGKQSDLILGGKIIDVESNGCYSVAGAKGEIYFRVEWQVYDNKKKGVVLTLSTEGFAAQEEFTGSGDLVFFLRAFDMAIDNLLASKEFFSLLTKENG